MTKLANGAQAGDFVVTGGGAVAAVAAAGHVVEVAAGQGIDGSVGRTQRAQAGQGASLVGNGDQAGPLRRPGTGAAHAKPAALAAVGHRIVDREAGVGVGVVGHVGRGPFSRALHALLIARLRHVTADAAAAVAPGGLRARCTRGGEAQRRSAHRHDVRRHGRPARTAAISPVAARNVTPTWPDGVVKLLS